MVRSDGWKLISTGVRGAEPPHHAPDHHRLAIFDRCDPGEYVNLIDTPQGQEVLRWAVGRHRDLSSHRVAARSHTSITRRASLRAFLLKERLRSSRPAAIGWRR